MNIILIVILIFLVAVIFYKYNYRIEEFKKHKNKVLEDYYYKVYPLAKKDTFYNNLLLKKLFFYGILLNVIEEYLGNHYNVYTSSYIQPCYGMLYIPALFVKSDTLKYIYPKNYWWKYQNIKGFRDNSLLEIYHTSDDTNQIYGFWCYYAPGTGMFLDIGKSFKTECKISALYKLGYSIKDIAFSLKDLRIPLYSANANTNVSDIAAKYYPEYDTMDEKLMQMVKDILNMPKLQANYNFKKLYEIYMCNNFTEGDRAIAEKCKEKGYDTVQLTCQANDKGGFAFEIVYVSLDPLLKPINADHTFSLWEGWNKLKKKIYIADPENKRNKKPCTIFLDADNRLMCREIGI